MATARYKALKEFEEDSVSYGIGNALILDPSNAEALIETGKIQLVKYLDPEDASDKAEIDHFTGNPTGAGKSDAEVQAEAQANEETPPDAPVEQEAAPVEADTSTENTSGPEETQQDQDSV